MTLLGSSLLSIVGLEQLPQRLKIRDNPFRHKKSCRYLDDLFQGTSKAPHKVVIFTVLQWNSRGLCASCVELCGFAVCFSPASIRIQDATPLDPHGYNKIYSASFPEQGHHVNTAKVLSIS